MHVNGKWFEDVAVGERFTGRMTITETHPVLGAGLIGDFNPHHVDDEYAKQSRFGTRILRPAVSELEPAGDRPGGYAAASARAISATSPGPL
jgi:hypothetical protein